MNAVTGSGAGSWRISGDLPGAEPFLQTEASRRACLEPVTRSSTVEGEPAPAVIPAKTRAASSVEEREHRRMEGA